MAVRTGFGSVSLPSDSEIVTMSFVDLLPSV